MKRVRKGSMRAAFDNEGPVVFLYDRSHLSAIRESGAEVLEGYGEGTADDPALPAIELLEKSAIELSRVTWGARDNFKGMLLVCKRTRRNATVPEAFFGSWTPY